MIMDMRVQWAVPVIVSILILGNIGMIPSANAALANGDSLKTSPTSFGDFKSAAAEYKVAISEAQGALP